MSWPFSFSGFENEVGIELGPTLKIMVDMALWRSIQ